MENLISHISELIIKFSDFVWEWNAPFLVGAGIYFLIFSKVTPFKYDGNSSRPAGISANLDAVQIVNFIEYESQDFAPVDGGYVQETEEVPF